MKPSFRIRPSIILFGDSLTEQGFGLDGKIGWASLLTSDYSRRADVLNRGYSGYTTRLALDMLPRVFPGPPQESCLFCTVFFGANDAALPGELQHVPVEEYGSNIGKIVDHIRHTFESTPSFPILLMTPPPFDAEMWMSFKDFDSPGRDNMVTKQYGDKLKEVATGLEMCSVVDTWTALEGSSEKRTNYLSDGLHLNEEGNRRVHKAIADVLKTEYPHLLPMVDGEGRHGTSGIPLEEPLWRDLLEN